MLLADEDPVKRVIATRKHDEKKVGDHREVRDRGIRNGTYWCAQRYGAPVPAHGQTGGAAVGRRQLMKWSKSNMAEGSAIEGDNDADHGRVVGVRRRGKGVAGSQCVRDR
jgi:hypothetical protein